MKLLAEQTILITGATDGLGKATALELAKLGARVLIHGRDDQRLAATQQQITAESGNDKIETYRANFASLAEVRHLAYTLQAEHEELNMLINNAASGGGKPGDSRRDFSADGYELRFAVNYLAPFLLTQLLLPSLRAGTPSRIINVSSAGQYPINFADVMMEQHYEPLDAYRQSKLAQIMYTFDLAERVKSDGITVNALHPASLMPTKMVHEYFGRTIDTLEDGVRSVLHLTTDPALDHVTGRYFDHQREARANDQAYDAEARQRLWQLSAELTDAEKIDFVGD
jgi:NAD(P)-dependent dehydrogenase (short-subunit alcohol dehydrogenase family)